MNTRGSYACRCKDGYEGDGRTSCKRQYTLYVSKCYTSVYVIRQYTSYVSIRHVLLYVCFNCRHIMQMSVYVMSCCMCVLIAGTSCKRQYTSYVSLRHVLLYFRGVNLYRLRVSRTDFCDLHRLTMQSLRIFMIFADSNLQSFHALYSNCC